MLSIFLLIIYTTLIPNKWLIKWHKIMVGSRYVLRGYGDNPFNRDDYTVFIEYIKDGYVLYYYPWAAGRSKSCSVEDFITSFKHTY